jgi:hypothetical protein
LIHGFAPPGLASNHRGQGQFIHTQFLPGGRRASLRPFQSADRHTPITTQRPPPGGLFVWACAGQTKLFRLAAKIPGTIHDRAAWICQRLAVPSARDTRRGTSPPPSGVLSWRPQAPYAGGRFSLATDWLYGDTAAPKVRGTVAPSHQSDSDFRRGANCFDCAQSHVVLFDPRRLRTTAMIDTVTMVLALMSGSIFLAHALDGLRSRA